MEVRTDCDLSKSEVLAAFFEKRLSSNLAMFKEFLPSLYDKFDNYRESNYFLVYDDFGNVNVLDKKAGVLLYGSNPVSQVLSQYEEYKENCAYRPFLSVGATLSKTNPVHSKLMSDLGEIQYQNILKNFINSELEKNFERFSSSDCSLNNKHEALPEKINSMIWLSVGLGFDLEKLYMERSVSNLYILEPNSDLFYASLQLIDWSLIIEKMRSCSFSIYFGFSDDFDLLVSDFSSHAFSKGRHQFSGSYFYSGFYIEEYDVLFERIRKEVELKIFSGFGFYDDARLSFAHTIGNLKNKVPCISTDSDIYRNYEHAKLPVYIVGNGPSIDLDIDFIKESSARAIVISCGSSLSTLYNNGIKPDIHVELERTADVYTFIKNTSKDDEAFERYLEGIVFVGASQVHPEVFSLFGKAGQLPKDVEAGSLFLHNFLKHRKPALIGRVAPSCVHIGLTAAVVFGFRNIFLFGTDMGYLDRKYHHSKNSLYKDMNEDASAQYTPSGNGEVEFKANFGDGVIYSSGFLPMFKNELELIIKAWKDTFPNKLSFVNCSDGALIEGADPVKSSDLFLESQLVDKDKVLKFIHDKFFSFITDDDDISVVDDGVEYTKEKIVNICDYLLGMLKEVDSIESAQKLIDSLSYDFHKNSDLIPDGDSWLYSFFDGTLLYALSVMVSTLYYPVDEFHRIKAANESFKAFGDFLESVKFDLDNNFLRFDSEDNYNYF